MYILTNQLGISLTEDKIQLVEIVNKDNSVYLENVDEEYFEESINENTKEAKFIHILQNAFNEIVLRKPVSSSKISVALPPQYFKIFQLPIDKNLTKNDVNEYIKWELTKLFPYDNNSSYSYQKIVLTSPKDESFKRILVFAIDQLFLKRIHKFCMRNNLTLQFIDHSLAASSTLINEEIKSHNILSLFVENNYLSVFLFSNNELSFEKSDPFISVPDISGSLKSIIDDIYSNEIVKNIDKIFIFGNEANKELCNDISEVTGIEIEKVLPFAKLNINPELQDSKYILNFSEKFAASASVAFRMGL